MLSMKKDAPVKSASGVSVGDELKRVINAAKVAKSHRWIKMKVSNTQWVESKSKKESQPSSTSASREWDSMMNEIDEKDPFCCFIFWKDSSKPVLVSFFPDDSKDFKAKMVYSASKAAIIEIIGKSVEQYAPTAKSELSWSKYQEQLKIEAPKSSWEEGLEEQKKTQQKEAKENHAGNSALAALMKSTATKRSTSPKPASTK